MFYVACGSADTKSAADDFLGTTPRREKVDHYLSPVDKIRRSAADNKMKVSEIDRLLILV